MEEPTVKEITAFENAIDNQGEGINPAVYWAYCRSKDTGNDLINFFDAILDTDVIPIVETFRENDITEFTISATFPRLISTLAAFEKHGFKIVGITEVNSIYSDRRTCKKVKIPAFHMEEETNQSLTLAEMKEMYRQPVWVKCLQPHLYDNPPIGWRILEKSIINTFGVWDGDDCLTEKGYGTDWLAYRRKPKEESK